MWGICSVALGVEEPMESPSLSGSPVNLKSCVVSKTARLAPTEFPETGVRQIFWLHIFFQGVFNRSLSDHCDQFIPPSCSGVFV